MTDQVEYFSDDGPEDDETPRLKILAHDDYYIQCSSGKGWKFANSEMRFCNSGARDPIVTSIIAGLFFYLKGDKDRASEILRNVGISIDLARENER